MIEPLSPLLARVKRNRRRLPALRPGSYDVTLALVGALQPGQGMLLEFDFDLPDAADLLRAVSPSLHTANAKLAVEAVCATPEQAEAALDCGVQAVRCAVPAGAARERAAAAAVYWGENWVPGGDVPRRVDYVRVRLPAPQEGSLRQVPRGLPVFLESDEYSLRLGRSAESCGAAGIALPRLIDHAVVAAYRTALRDREMDDPSRLRAAERAAVAATAETFLTHIT